MQPHCSDPKTSKRKLAARKMDPLTHEEIAREEGDHPSILIPVRKSPIGH
jgi:hypothetical protein